MKKRSKLAQIEEDGYTVGWVGLDKYNPYQRGTLEWERWEIGYQSAIDDETSMSVGYYPSNEYGDDEWYLP